MKLSPTARCRTRAWPGPGSPTSAGSHCSTSGPPFWCIRMACGMVRPPVRLGSYYEPEWGSMVSMALRTLLFLAVVLLVLGGACAYMAERSMAMCPALAVHPGLVRGVMVLFAVLLFALPALHRVPGLARAVDPMFGLSYGLFSFLSTYLPYLAAADLLQALAGLFGL